MQSPSSFPSDGNTASASLVTAQKEYHTQIHIT